MGKVQFFLLRLSLISMLASLTLTACNLPTNIPGNQAESNPPYPIRTSPGSDPTFTPAPVLTTSKTQATMVFAGSTISPGPTSALLCERAAPGNPLDITIPDDTPLQPGQPFTKTWRLQNIGSCPWTTGFAVVFFSGKSLGANQSNYINNIVNPGDIIDVSVDMVSPVQPGTYQGNWKLSDAQKQLFGIGPNGESPFWVRIVVAAPDTATPLPVIPTMAPTAAVATFGAATLKLDDALDLDENKITAPPNDVVFSVNATNSFELIPQSGARLSVYGKNEPEDSDCLIVNGGQEAIIVDTISNGTFFCYHTKRGMPGWLRLVTLNVQDKTVALDFLTWAVP